MRQGSSTSRAKGAVIGLVQQFDTRARFVRRKFAAINFRAVAHNAGNNASRPAWTRGLGASTAIVSGAENIAGSSSPAPRLASQ